MSAESNARNHVREFRWYQGDPHRHPVATKMYDLVVLIQTIEELYQEYDAEARRETPGSGL